jgi:Flp pilus assembly pilin Flp
MGITRRNKQAGQGMTEYIIIVALIAIAAIGVYSLFGQTIRGQTGQMASEMGGQAGTGARDAAKSAGQEGASAGADRSKNKLGTYGGEQK